MNAVEITTREELSKAYDRAFDFLDSLDVQIVSPEELREEYFEQAKANSLKILLKMQLSDSSFTSISSSLRIKVKKAKEPTPSPRQEQEESLISEGEDSFFSPSPTSKSTCSVTFSNCSSLLEKRKLNLKRLDTVSGHMRLSTGVTLHTCDESDSPEAKQRSATFTLKPMPLQLQQSSVY